MLTKTKKPWKKSSQTAASSWQIGETSAKPQPFDAVQIYMDMAHKAVTLKKQWRVVVDPGCGAAYNVAPNMLKELGCKVTALNAQPDGHFPARKSEPTAESLQDLCRNRESPWRRHRNRL